MAGLLVQSAVLPALHGSRAQVRRSAKTRVIARVTMSKLQTRVPSLRFAGNRTSLLGTGPILMGQAMRPVRKQGKRFVVKAMFERFTEKAIKVIMLAQEEARRLGHNFVGTEQLLLGLIGEGTGIAAKVLKSMGINLKDARVEVEKIIGRGSGFVAVEIPFTPRAKRVLELSLEEARQLGHNYIGSEHLLLGLLREGEGVAARVLESLGADPSNIRTQVIRMVGESTEAVSAGVGGGSSGQKMPTLEEYGTNLTKLAEEGKLDPVVGRQEQIEHNHNLFPNPNPNPRMEGDGEDEPAARGRNWAELQRDALVVIFLKLGSMEVLRVAGSVCRSWRRVSKEEPGLWRKIDMTNHNYGSDASLLSDPTKQAIDRSGGLLEEFSVEYFGDDDLLQYLCERTSVLKKLSLISCYKLSDETLAETARKQPRLEELQIIFGSFRENVTEILGKECPQLKNFKFNNTWRSVPPSDPDDNDEVFDDHEALGIAKTMHQLCHLQLIGNRLTNKGLKAILDGCPNLETLDIRCCYNVSMDSDMRSLCSRLKTIRLPGDSVDDYDFQADADHEFCSDEDDFYHDLDLDLDYDYDFDYDDDYENYLLDLDDIFDDDEEDDDDDVDYIY